MNYFTVHKSWLDLTSLNLQSPWFRPSQLSLQYRVLELKHLGLIWWEENLATWRTCNGKLPWFAYIWSGFTVSLGLKPKLVEPLSTAQRQLRALPGFVTTVYVAPKIQRDATR